jgi:hypothetical protein
MGDFSEIRLVTLLAAMALFTIENCRVRLKQV